MTAQIRAAVIVATGLALVLSGSPAPAATEILMIGTQFVPAVVQAPAGQQVIFRNNEPADYGATPSAHNVTYDTETGPAIGAKRTPTSGLINRGGSWSFKPSAGTYAFKCGLHEWMRGLLVVS